MTNWPTCIFVHQPSCLKLTSYKYVEVNIYSHLQALSKDIFIRPDYAFSALETTFCLMGGTSEV